MDAPVPAPNKLLDCNLVMKGGVTSGVVYPAAVRILKDRFQFRSVGGASAGAIAAAATAAAELARQKKTPASGSGSRKNRPGFEGLADVEQELSRPDFFEKRFVPERACRG